MKSFLIVNADDCNLTRGVTDAILTCHEEGIVSSTTWMANLPFEKREIQALKAQKRLGVGIHLNITLGEPVSRPAQVKSLLGEKNHFKKVRRQLERYPRAREVALEYKNQIAFFQKIFGRRPTHLDTHHQLHDHPFFFRILAEIAKRQRLPIRRSRCMLSEAGKWKTTDFFFGNFSPLGYWRDEALEYLLVHLPGGVSEIMCHPGRLDSDLQAVSSFTVGREKEFHLFTSRKFRRLLAENSIHLTHFGLMFKA